MKKVVKVLVIVLASLIVVLGAGFGFLYANGLSGMSHTSAAKEGQIKVACVGDSITYGHGITGWPNNNYPSKLQEELGEDYHVNNYGVSGYCVQDDADKPYTSLSHYQDSLVYDADIVIFMMGSNDAKPKNWKGETAFLEAYSKLVTSYKNKGSKVYLCTPATAYKVNFEIEPKTVETIANLVRTSAILLGCEVIDINNFTKDHPEWFLDGIHPNNDGAKAIATEIASKIK